MSQNAQHDDNQRTIAELTAEKAHRDTCIADLKRNLSELERTIQALTEALKAEVATRHLRGAHPDRVAALAKSNAALQLAEK